MQPAWKLQVSGRLLSLPLHCPPKKWEPPPGAIQMGTSMAELEWLSPRQVSEKYGIKEETLKYWRGTGYGPVGSKWGRMVRYRASDWEDWTKLEQLKAQIR